MTGDGRVGAIFFFWLQNRGAVLACSEARWGTALQGSFGPRFITTWGALCISCPTVELHE